MKKYHSHLKLKYLGIDTYKESVIYMKKNCHICRSEGFATQARIQVSLNGRSLTATLNTIETDLLSDDEASLSCYAWDFLQANEGDQITMTHPPDLLSLSDIHSKIYGHDLDATQFKRIMDDVMLGHLSDIHLASFLTATAGNRLNSKEVLLLTEAMINTGQKLVWPSSFIVDKHCVGGLPGNRTTLIVVPIVAAFGLMIPKTSSRAITSPAGTADTMEVLAPVDLDIKMMRKVVDQEGGCIVWGGSVALSPVDDLLIQIERAMDLDSEGQLVASVISKKIAAGSTHLLIDIPIGPTAKIRSMDAAIELKALFESVGKHFGLTLNTVFSDGSQPVGRGIGPAFEAMDVLAVLRGESNAPQDLRERALTFAGNILEFSPKVLAGQGKQLAETILDSGQALKKFVAICEAQGGLREIPQARYSHVVLATQAGKITQIDNRHIAKVAKLAGAPRTPAAGVLLHVAVGSIVAQKQPLYTVYSNSQGELNYSLTFLQQNPNIIRVDSL